jgi:hypothetical protein
VPEVERVEPRVDRLGALEVHDGGEHAVGARGVEVARRAREPDVAVALQREQAAGHRGRVRRRQVGADRRRERHVEAPVGRRLERRVVARRVGEQREDAARQAARPRPRQVEVAAGPARDEAVRVLAGEDVVVAVEDRDRRGAAPAPPSLTRRPGTALRSGPRTSRRSRCA